MAKTIYNKEEILEALDQEVSRLIEWCSSLDQAEFLKSFNGKWNAAEQLEHLRKSSKPLVMALRLPKIVLRLKVGQANRPSRTFVAVEEKYETKLAEHEIGTTKFFPDSELAKSSDQIINDYRKTSDKLLKAIGNWREPELDNYILPHPLLGKLTVREMLFFTIHHTRHHHNHLIALYV